MKYFKAVNIDDVTEETYISCNCDVNIESTEKLLGLKLVEVSQEEFETMTQEDNDYIINVGQTRDNLRPFDSAHTEDEAIKKAEQYTEDWKCVEVVYMPVDDDDINEIICGFYDAS
jgi:hypothetical protein